MLIKIEDIYLPPHQDLKNFKFLKIMKLKHKAV